MPLLPLPTLFVCATRLCVFVCMFVCLFVGMGVYVVPSVHVSVYHMFIWRTSMDCVSHVSVCVVGPRAQGGEDGCFVSSDWTG